MAFIKRLRGSPLSTYTNILGNWEESSVQHKPVFTELMQVQRATVISAGHRESLKPKFPDSQQPTHKVGFSGGSTHQLYHFPAQEF